MNYKWKFLQTGMKSSQGECTWKKGIWKHEDELSICKYGFHCSKEINQAFSFVQGEILARVAVKGKSIINDDKECWTDMKIVKAYKWGKMDSVELAIYAAELVIDIFEKEYPNDKRPRQAIEAAKSYVKNPTKENAYASNAASNAAYASYAASNAASYAASYARKELVQKIESWMVKRVKRLEEIV